MDTGMSTQLMQHKLQQFLYTGDPCPVHKVHFQMQLYDRFLAQAARLLVLVAHSSTATRAVLWSRYWQAHPHCVRCMQCEVMVTAGANQAFTNVVLTLLDASSKVVLFKPYYFNHLMAIQMTGGTDHIIYGRYSTLKQCPSTLLWSTVMEHTFCSCI